MNDCNNGISIPTLTSDSCQGKRISTNCVFSPTAVTYLGLPANSSIETIFSALLVSLVDARARIATLEGQVILLDNRVTLLE